MRKKPQGISKAEYLTSLDLPSNSFTLKPSGDTYKGIKHHEMVHKKQILMHKKEIQRIMDSYKTLICFNKNATNKQIEDECKSRPADIYWEFAHEHGIKIDILEKITSYMKGKPLKRHMIFTLKNTAYKLFLYIGACLLFSLLRAEEIQQRQDEQIYIDTYLKISEIYDKAIQDEDFDKFDSSYKRKIIKELHYVSIKFNLSDIYVSYNFRRPKVSDKVFCTPIVGINYRYNSELNQHIKETSNKKGIDVCSLFTAAICVLDEMYFLHHFINDKEIRNIPSIQTNITQPSFTRLEKNKEVIERRQFYIDYLNSKKGKAQKKVPRGVMASITAKERNVKQSILTVTLKPEYKIFDSIELVRLYKKLHILSQL